MIHRLLVFAFVALALFPEVLGQDSLRTHWQAYRPDSALIGQRIDLVDFAPLPLPPQPLPAIEEHGWTVLMLRTDEAGRPMGHTVLLETGGPLSDWLLGELEQRTFRTEVEGPLMGWLVFEYGHCLPCGESSFQARGFTYFSTLRPVNSRVSPEPDEWFGGIREPKPLNFQAVQKNIDYPQVLRESLVEGRVFVRIKVNPFGRVADHKVLRADHPLFEKVVVEALPELRFVPALYDDGRGEAWVVLPFRFRLR